jgi:hypothetical protein
MIGQAPIPDKLRRQTIVARGDDRSSKRCRKPIKECTSFCLPSFAEERDEFASLQVIAGYRIGSDQSAGYPLKDA